MARMKAPASTSIDLHRGLSGQGASQLVDRPATDTLRRRRLHRAELDDRLAAAGDGHGLPRSAAASRAGRRFFASATL
jgi:hypothetical protein